MKPLRANMILHPGLKNIKGTSFDSDRKLADIYYWVYNSHAFGACIIEEMTEDLTYTSVPLLPL